MIDKKVISMVKEIANSPAKERRQKNIKVTTVPKKNENTEKTNSPKEKSLKEYINEFLFDLADGFSYDTEILNGAEAAKFIRTFILKTIGIIILYTVCFTFIVIIPIRNGYWISMVTAIPVLLLFIGLIILQEISLYGKYIIPVKRYCEYRRKNETGLF